MGVVALTMYALTLGLIIGVIVGVFGREIYLAIAPSKWAKPMPEGVNNAIINLHMIASGRDTVTGDMIVSGDMMQLAKDALEAIYKEYR